MTRKRKLSRRPIKLGQIYEACDYQTWFCVIALPDLTTPWQILVYSLTGLAPGWDVHGVQLKSGLYGSCDYYHCNVIVLDSYSKLKTHLLEVQKRDERGFPNP